MCQNVFAFRGGWVFVPLLVLLWESFSIIYTMYLYLDLSYGTYTIIDPNSYNSESMNVEYF